MAAGCILKPWSPKSKSRVRLLCRLRQVAQAESLLRRAATAAVDRSVRRTGLWCEMARAAWETSHAAARECRNSAGPPLSDQNAKEEAMKERREMVYGVYGPPTLGVRFDIDKLNAKFDCGSYGVAGWKVIWQALDVTKFRSTVFLFDGDTDDTLSRRERVWCAAFQASDAGLLTHIRDALESSAEFLTVAASPRFMDGVAVVREPLPGSGCVGANGEWVGKTTCHSFEAFESVKGASPKSKKI